MATMSPTLRAPSQSCRMAAPVSLRRTAPSGYSNTGRCRTGSKSRRASRQSFGRESAVRSLESGATLLLPVRVVDGVDHDPEHLELERESFKRALLRFHRGAVLLNQGESLLAVPWSLNEAASEVGQALQVYPGVVLGKRRDSAAHESGRKKLGQRGGHSFDPGSGLAEGHIRFGGKPDPGQNVPLVLHLCPGNSHRLAQANPHLDATGSGLSAVVVHDPLHPRSAPIGERAVGDNGRILPGNRALIGQAVGHPALQLTRRKPPLMHEMMERVVSVIRGAEGAKTLGQHPGRQRPGERRNRRRRWSSQLRWVERSGHGHRVKLIPSAPTRMPACSTAERSGESSRSIGLLLLMWVYTRRVSIAESRARLPSGPDTGR